MVGGIVTKVLKFKDRVFVDCVETNSTSKCAIFVERNETSEKIQPADSLWWQGRFAMWTPYALRSKHRTTEGLRGGKDYDIKIPRIGYSGASLPSN